MITHPNWNDDLRKSVNTIAWNEHNSAEPMRPVETEFDAMVVLRRHKLDADWDALIEDAERFGDQFGQRFADDPYYRLLVMCALTVTNRGDYEGEVREIIEENPHPVYKHAYLSIVHYSHEFGREDGFAYPISLARTLLEENPTDFIAGYRLCALLRRSATSVDDVREAWEEVHETSKRISLTGDRQLALTIQERLVQEKIGLDALRTVFER